MQGMLVSARDGGKESAMVASRMLNFGMSRRAALRLIALTPALVPVVAEAARKRIGNVTAIKGKAKGELEGASRTLKLKAPVYLRETVITGAEARLQALLAAKTTLKLGADTR